MWRLKDSIMVAPLNNDHLHFKLTFLDGTKKVREEGHISFKGGMLSLEWWKLETRCVRKEYWITKSRCVW